MQLLDVTLWYYGARLGFGLAQRNSRRRGADAIMSNGVDRGTHGTHTRDYIVGGSG